MSLQGPVMLSMICSILLLLPQTRVAKDASLRGNDLPLVMPPAALKQTIEQVRAASLHRAASRLRDGFCVMHQLGIQPSGLFALMQLSLVVPFL
jgi:hypothetical protein